MAAGVILTELHDRLIGLDAQGNIALNTSGIAAEDVARGGPPGIVGKGIPTNLAITNAPGPTSNISNVTFQVQDCFGANIAGNFAFDMLLSDSATGFGLTATTASGGFAAATGGGAILGALTTSKAATVQTNASGTFILSITDTAKTGFVPAAYLGSIAAVGKALTSASYK